MNGKASRRIGFRFGKAVKRGRQRFGALPLFARVPLVLCLVALGLQVIYLAAANWVLSGKLESWANGDDFLLTYDSASSLWPGHVNVKNLRLRTSDANVQIELKVERAKVDVNLQALLSRKFHATHVETSGTAFRLRYKVDEVGKNALRLAAYPPIAGYADPPLREPESPPEPDSPDDDWSVRLDDVTAHVRELWFVEYRYDGAAVATGSFELHPGRFLVLEPAKLRFEAGTVRVGERLLAAHLRGTLDAEILPTEIEPISGLEIFRTVSAQFDAKMQGGDLAVANVYLEPRLPFSVEGLAEVSIDAGMKQGTLTPGTSIEWTAKTATLSTDTPLASGDLTLRAEVPTTASPPTLRLSVQSDEWAAQAQRGPTVRNLRASLELEPTDVSKPLLVRHRALSVDPITVPDLGWFDRWTASSATQLAGRAELRLAIAGQASEGGTDDSQSSSGATGDFALSLRDFSLDTKTIGVELEADAKAQFESKPGEKLSVENLLIEVDSGTLRIDDERSEPWSAELESNSTRVLDQPLAFQTTTDIRLKRAGALVPLVLPDLPAKIAELLLDLEQLEARVALYVDDDLTRLEVLSAKAEDLSIAGAWQRSGKAARGAFLFETPLSDFGVKLDAGKTDIDWGATRAFLAQDETVHAGQGQR